MPKSILEVADEVYQLIAPLPVGFSISLTENDGIMIGTDELAFVLTKLNISDHLGRLDKIVVPSFRSLKSAIAQHYAMRAADLDKAMLISVADYFSDCPLPTFGRQQKEDHNGRQSPSQTATGSQ